MREGGRKGAKSKKELSRKIRGFSNKEGASQRKERKKVMGKSGKDEIGDEERLANKRERGQE